MVDLKQEQLPLPRIKRGNGPPQLLVDGKPFLILGGELQNSSMTSARYMDTVWQPLKDSGLNTVLGSITWEDIEPEEDAFKFTELDANIKGARSHGLRLILLWFGSFKNGVSTYAPRWVKTNPARFPRAVLRKAGGRLQTSDVLSTFYTEAQKADAKAFSTLMAYLGQTDIHHTVIMVQVENEIGLLGDSRDGSKAADQRFGQPVPDQLLKYLGEEWAELHTDLKAKFPNLQATLKDANGKSWTEVFGNTTATDEIFMAYHYALYTEQVASAGRREYAIPLYTNVWQNYVSDDADNAFPAIAGGGGDPGDYPSGGGVSNVIDIWQKFAPSLDFIAPDVYLNDYALSCMKYRHKNQPLFIPEQRRDEYGARRIWTAFGSYQAIGTSPFGIDTLVTGKDPNPFAKHYGLLASVSKIVLDAQQIPGSSIGFFFDEVSDDGKGITHPKVTQFGEYQVTIERSFVFGKAGAGAGMVINTGTGRFILIGWGFQATFTSTQHAFTGILSFTEKRVVDVENGILQTERNLNGDETRGGRFCIMPNEEPDYGGFPICVTIPARTMIAEVEVYSMDTCGGN